MYLPASLSLACLLLLLFHCWEILLSISPWKHCNKMYYIWLICLIKALHWFDEHWHVVQWLSQGVFVTHVVFVTWVLSWAGVWPWTEKCQNKPLTRHHLPSWPHLRCSVDQITMIKWSTNRQTAAQGVHRVKQAVLPAADSLLWHARSRLPSALGSRYRCEKKGGKKEKGRQKEKKKYRWERPDLPSQGQKLIWG